MYVDNVVFMLLWIQKIIPPVLKSFTDQDSRVRYYACEALYNIAKVGGLILSLESSIIIMLHTA